MVRCTLLAAGEKIIRHSVQNAKTEKATCTRKELHRYLVCKNLRNARQKTKHLLGRRCKSTGEAMMSKFRMPYVTRGTIHPGHDSPIAKNISSGGLG